MLTLSQALQERFPAGEAWVRDVVDAIDEVSLDSEVHDVAQGWMRVGEGTSRLVDALFVLTEEGLGFGQPSNGAAERWVPLAAITAIDAIEGTGHPLEAVEIHLSGGMAMLIGLPEPFVEVLVSVLERQVAASPPPEPVTMPRDLDEEAAPDASTLDGLPPSPWVETDVHLSPWAPVTDRWAPPGTTPEPSEATASGPGDERAGEPPPRSSPQAPTFLASVDLAPVTPAPSVPPADRDVVIDRLAFADASSSGETPSGTEAESRGGFDAYRFDPTVPFDAPDPTEIQHEDAGDTPPVGVEPGGVDPVDDFFASDDHGGAALSASSTTDPHEAARSIQFPEPFKGVSYLGGHPDHPRKRKNSVLVFSTAGVAMTGGGLGGGQFAIPWAQIRSLDVQGADEVKFTHNHRIDLNSSAVIVELRSGDVLVFEVKLRRPATMRSTLAPILSMVRSIR